MIPVIGTIPSNQRKAVKNLKIDRLEIRKHERKICFDKINGESPFQHLVLKGHPYCIGSLKELVWKGQDY